MDSLLDSCAALASRMRSSLAPLLADGGEAAALEQQPKLMDAAKTGLSMAPHQLVGLSWCASRSHFTYDLGELYL